MPTTGFGFDSCLFSTYPNPLSVFMLGMDGGNTFNYKPGLTTNEAFQMDTKVDDGIPGMGLVQTLKPGGSSLFCTATGCATSAAASTAVYDLNSKAMCTMVFNSKL